MNCCFILLEAAIVFFFFFKKRDELHDNLWLHIHYTTQRHIFSSWCSVIFTISVMKRGRLHAINGTLQQYNILQYLASVLIAHANIGIFSCSHVSISAVPSSVKSNLVCKTKLYPDWLCHLQISFNSSGNITVCST
jgi:hypothetical protein